MKGDYIMRRMYSKKQIEEIAKSSGTKLYRHIIETTIETDKLIIISTDSSQYDVNNLTPSLISIVGVYVELPNCPYKDN